MRRKLFLFTIITIFSLTAADYAGIRLYDNFPEDMLGKQIFYEGTVTGIERWDEDGLSVKVRVEYADGKKLENSCFLLLSMYGEKEKPWKLWQGKIGFKCAADLAAEAGNPGCFSYRRHLLSEGITAVGSAKDFKLLEENDSPLRMMQKKLTELKYMFAESLSEETRGIIMGMVFGDTSFLDEDIYEAFRNNGTAHVLAVSGLHVGIVYGIIKKAAGKRQSLISLFISCALLFIYCFLSAFSVSAMRAAYMIMLSAWGSYRDRRYDMLTAAAFTALIFITFNPYIVFNTGFQMSFMAVCSIGFFMKRLPPKIPDAAAIMLAANIGLVPYQIYVFNWFSYSSFIANIPVVYLAGITVPLGVIHFITYSLAGETKLLSVLTDSLAYLITKVNEFLSFGGRGGCDMVSPPLWLLLFAYLTIFFLASEQMEIMRLRKERGKIMAVVGMLFIFALFIKSASFMPIRNSDLVFVDVGQGDCLHIQEKETDILIDGGGKTGYNVGKNTLKPYLLKNGVRKIDLALATHLHTDHFKGLEELKEEGMIKRLETGVTAGKIFEISEDVAIETLWPLSLEDDPNQDENRSCSVFMVYFKGFKILVTGDLDSEGERKMVEFYHGSGRLRADILKISHHGSKTGTSEELLLDVMPEYAVIQVGKNNYGHPDAKIIEKCREKGIIVLRNDTHGAVGFSFEKGEIRHCEMKKPETEAK